MPKEKRSIRDQLRGRTQDQHSEKDSGGKGWGVLNTEGLGEELFFKPEIGNNAIDIIPYVVKTDKHPKLKPGDVDYVLDVWVHKKIGAGEDSYVCLKKTYKKACPICEEMAKLTQDGGDEDTIDALKPKHRVFYNVINLNAKAGNIQLFEQSHFKFEKELLEEAETGDGEIMIFSDPVDGYSVKFKGRKASFKGRDFTEIKNISLEEREEQYEDSVVDDAYSLDELLIVPSYEEISNAFYGIESEAPAKKKARPDDEDDEEKEEVKETPKKEVKKSKKNSCPYGHEFGKDCDAKKECKKCEEWDACSDAYDEQ